MKLTLSVLLLLCCTALLAPGATPAAQSTNSLVVDARGEGMFTPTNAVWRRQVRAGDGEIYLECELLTLYFSTNSVRTNTVASPRRAEGPGTDSRFERMVAETNVMIIFQNIQIMGDRADYHSTNDLLLVTGNPVLVENETGYMVCAWVTYHRPSNTTVFGAPNTTFVSTTLMSRTNAPSNKPRTNAPSASK